RRGARRSLRWRGPPRAAPPWRSRCPRGAAGARPPRARRPADRGAPGAGARRERARAQVEQERLSRVEVDLVHQLRERLRRERRAGEPQRRAVAGEGPGGGPADEGAEPGRHKRRRRGPARGAPAEVLADDEDRGAGEAAVVERVVALRLRAVV